RGVDARDKRGEKNAQDRSTLAGEIADCGLRIADCSARSWRRSFQNLKSQISKSLEIRNLQAAIRNQMFCFFSSAIKYSAARHESAIIVSVGFLCVPEAKAAASVTNRFFTSHDWLNWLRTEVFGSLPI